ncbi:MAG: (2Fe-2S)-binding protein [Candidatus Dependentiae bacterium]|nr:(2Fe-2S)-binding protein [Candidatus Dependentiae bacterium]
MSDFKSPLGQRPDYLVCTCFGVMYSEICLAIKKGCKDFESLQDSLMVGTGCSSCVNEVKDILKESLAE